jgi:hypothetical protein
MINTLGKERGAEMKDIISDHQLVAYCGLYCGACKRYLNDKCPGCHDNEKASWCKIRSCCSENQYQSCADCSEYSNPNDCKKFNNFMSKIFGFIFQSNRAACIQKIKELEITSYAEYMAKQGLQSIKR